MLKEARGLSAGWNIVLEAAGLAIFREARYLRDLRGRSYSVDVIPPPLSFTLLGFLWQSQKGSDCWHYSERPHGWYSCESGFFMLSPSKQAIIQRIHTVRRQRPRMLSTSTLMIKGVRLWSICIIYTLITTYLLFLVNNNLGEKLLN